MEHKQEEWKDGQDHAGNQDHSADGQKEKNGGIHNNALYAASMGRPATAAVDPHSNAGLAQTGTNVSYEGPTAPGGGGSAGTGYASGQSATGNTVTTNEDYDAGNVTPRKEDDTEGQDTDTAH